MKTILNKYLKICSMVALFVLGYGIGTKMLSNSFYHFGPGNKNNSQIANLKQNSRMGSSELSPAGKENVISFSSVIKEFIPEEKKMQPYARLIALDAYVTGLSLCLENINPFKNNDCPDSDKLMEEIADNRAEQDDWIGKIQWADIPFEDKKNCEKNCRCSLLLRIIESNNFTISAKEIKYIESGLNKTSNESKIKCLEVWLK